jgi:hypothetical protein
MLRRWISRSWFRHPLSLRGEWGRVAAADLWLTGQVGLPHFYWNFDKGWHAKTTRFLGVAWSLGPYDYYVGLRDSN